MMKKGIWLLMATYFLLTCDSISSMDANLTNSTSR